VKSSIVTVFTHTNKHRQTNIYACWGNHDIEGEERHDWALVRRGSHNQSISFIAVRWFTRADDRTDCSCELSGM